MAWCAVRGGRGDDKRRPTQPSLRIEFRRCGGQRFLGFGTEAFEIFDLGQQIAGAGFQFAQGTVVGFAKAHEVFADFFEVGEEGVETALAGVAGDDAELAGEAADLVFLLLVLLRARDMPFSRILAVLAARAGVRSDAPA